MARLKLKALGADCILEKHEKKFLSNGTPVYGELFVDCHRIKKLTPQAVTQYLFDEGIIPDGYVVALRAKNVRT
jgi:hypothetical protein